MLLGSGWHGTVIPEPVLLLPLRMRPVRWLAVRSEHVREPHSSLAPNKIEA